MLRIRRTHAALGDGPLCWLEAPDGVVAFDRGGGFSCLVNVSAEPMPLPAHGEVLIASGPLDAHRLPLDTAVRLRVD